MNILIAGASGFIGTALVNALRNEHTITLLGRDSAHLDACFPHHFSKVTWDRLNEIDPQGLDIVINLSGQNIGASRWSASVKERLILSRTKTNAALIEWIATGHATPRFISANAVGIYGMQDPRETTAFDEHDPIDFNAPKDFLSEIGVAWQTSADHAQTHGMPVTTLRFGVVLKRGQGMLKKLELSFKAGLGATLGSGEQMLSWIHVDDLISAVRFVIEHPELTGAINLTAPNPVTQKTFAKTFAKTLHRPQVLTMPAFVVKLLFGEMGESLLLSGQRVVPRRLLEQGFEFQYPTLEMALEKEY